MRSLINWTKARIRALLLRRKFATSVISHGVSLDNDSVLGEYTVLFKGVALIDSTVGDYSYVQSATVVCHANIGKFCSIASNVHIGLIDHPVDMVSTSPVFYDNSQPLPRFLTDKILFATVVPRTVIGADVWIGQGVMIKAGVTIGVGAVIGAGSVVTKDIAPYTIAAGNPCKQIRTRFSEDIISRLINTNWWMLNNQQIQLLAHLFVDPVKLLNELEQPK